MTLISTMLSTLSKLLPDKEHDIHVVQYERADFGVGSEEELHWAIVVLPPGKPKGRSFQVIDRYYQDERGVQWNLHDQTEDLRSTRKCFGGVRIGRVKGGDVDDLYKVCRTFNRAEHV